MNISMQSPISMRFASEVTDCFGLAGDATLAFEHRLLCVRVKSHSSLGSGLALNVDSLDHLAVHGGILTLITVGVEERVHEDTTLEFTCICTSFEKVMDTPFELLDLDFRTVVDGPLTIVGRVREAHNDG